MNGASQDASERHGVSCLSLFWTFFRVGLTTFGGGFAMAAVLRHELVLKRRWLTEREFFDTLCAATAVPGAVAVNLAFLEGRRMRGLPGGAAAAVGTMCPSVVVILLLARLAAPHFEHPVVAAFLKGCAIAVAGQIAFAALAFVRGLRRHWHNAAVCGLGLFILAMGLHPVWAVAAAAVLGYLIMRKRMARRTDEAEAELDLLELIEGITAPEFVTGSFEADLKEVLGRSDEAMWARFDTLLEECPVLDSSESMSVDEFLDLAAEELAPRLHADATTLASALKERESKSSTVLNEWLALPHVVLPGGGAFEMLIARSRAGIRFSQESPDIHAAFVLVGSVDQRDFYLRAIAAIARMADNSDSPGRWLKAEGKRGLKEAVRLAGRTAAD